MKRYSFLLFLLLQLPTVALSQLVQKKLIVPPQFQAIIDTNKTVMIPDDYEISVYYTDPANLKRPRFMALGPNNTIYVADMQAGHIVLLVDANNDGVADGAFTCTPDVDTAHSLAFYNGDLYVAQPSRIRKFLDKNHDGFFETEEPFISGISDTGFYNHFTRTILFDTAGKHIYLGVGASCNACREGDPERGTILQFNLDGSGRRIFATGLRNALGLAVNPENGSLWATNADRDNLGDEVPEEMITQISDGAFYGWPFAYGNTIWDDFHIDVDPEYQGMLPITASDSATVNSMRVADIHIPAHMTPMEIMFYNDPRVYIQPPPLTAFVAVHGSSPGGRKIGRGYKVLQIQLDKKTQAWTVSDFLTGFLTDSVNYAYWGRPCGMVQDTNKDIFLSCDLGIPAIYRIHLKDQGSVTQITAQSTTLSVFPNPLSSSATISYSLPRRQYIALELIDQLGRVVHLLRSGNEDAGARSIPFSVGDLPAGLYFLELQSDDGMKIQKVVIRK